MSTPVLIPARNEEAFIGRTLNHLVGQDVDPIVITNGCVDNTAQIAASFGVRVISSEECGRIPALQLGIKELGERSLDPFLIIDADSRPATRFWAGSMLKAMAKSDAMSSALSGPLAFIGEPDIPTNTMRTARNWYRQTKGRVNPTGERIFCGANQCIKLGSVSVKESLLDLPNFWPGTDKAIVEKITDNGGEHVTVLSPLALVLTDGSRSVSFKTTISSGFSNARRKNYLSYLEDAPAGSVPNRFE